MIPKTFGYTTKLMTGVGLNVFRLKRLKKLTETDQPLTNTETYWHCLTTNWNVLSITDTD